MAVTVPYLNGRAPNGTARYVALLTTLPTQYRDTYGSGNNTVGIGLVEASGNGYARVACSSWIDELGSEGINYRKNNTVIEFPVLTGPLLGIVGWAIYDASTSGNLLAWGPIVNFDGEETLRNFFTGEMPRFCHGELLIGSSDDLAAINNVNALDTYTAAQANSWSSVVFSPELGRLVAVAYDGTNRVMTSDDGGQTWTARTAAAANAWWKVVWCSGLNTTGLFVAISTDGGASQVMTSPDGITWTIRTTAETGTWVGLSYSPELNRIVAFNFDGVRKAMYSDDGITWYLATAGIPDNGWNAVCWSPELGIFCAVAGGGVATGHIVTSENGIDWTARTETSVEAWFSIIWASGFGLFIALSATDGEMMHSPDGITWTATAGNTELCYCMAYSEELNYVYAVSLADGDDISRVLVIYQSTDGALHQAAVSADEMNNWYDICWAPDVGRFVAVAINGTHQVMTIETVADGTGEIDCLDELSAPKLQAFMPPGLAWVRDSDTVMTLFLRALAYSFARVSRRALDLLEEADPRTTYELLEDWERVYGLPDECTQPTTLAGRRAAIVAKMSGNVDPSKANIIARAAVLDYDLRIYEWKREDLFDCTSDCNDWLYTDQWMFLWSATYWPGDTDAELFCSLEQVTPDHTMLYDGVRLWQNGSASEASVWRSVAWSSTTRKLVAVASSGTNRVMHSETGSGNSWTSASAAAAQVWMCVIWVEELELYVACSTSGTNRCMTSPDGITWTLQALTITNSWLALAYSPELDLIVAVSSNGTNRVATSPDSITWTNRTAAATSAWQDVCWSPELGLFVAVANSGTNRVMTSPDGIAWTVRNAAEANEWNSVCWSAELGLFVAVAFTGTNRVMTSPDGITWTARASAEQTEYKKVVWCKETAAFVAVGTNSMFSLDGITWKVFDVAEANVWHGLVWAPELSRLIAVAATGTNRVNIAREQVGRRFYKAIG